MAKDISPAEQEAALAEFDALRQEILMTRGQQHGLFVTYLTVAGAVFGFVLSGTSRTSLLLVVPFLAYLVAARYVARTQDILRMGAYIRNYLSVRVTGGLGWEDWIVAHPAKQPFLWLGPLLLSYVGSAMLALIGSATYVLHQLRTWPGAMLSLVWVAGAALTVLSAQLIIVGRGRKL